MNSIAPCEPVVCPTHSDLGVIGGDLAGFPNGRRLSDDIIDVSLRVVEGVLIPGHDPAVCRRFPSDDGLVYRIA